MPNQLFLKSAQTLSSLLFSFFIIAVMISFTLLPVQSHARDFYQGRNVSAGLYLRIPFGPTKRNDDRLKYGLRLNMSREFNNMRNGAAPFAGRQYINMDLMSVNFSESGFRNLSLAGRKTLVYRDGVLRAASDDEDSMSGGKITFLIGALLGVAFIAVAVAEKK